MKITRNFDLDMKRGTHGVVFLEKWGDLLPIFYTNLRLTKPGYLLSENIKRIDAIVVSVGVNNVYRINVIKKQNWMALHEFN